MKREQNKEFILPNERKNRETFPFFKVQSPDFYANYADNYQTGVASTVNRKIISRVPFFSNSSS